MTLSTLALAVWSLAAAQPASSACVLVEVSAVGRGAHGATVMRHSAPHRLIRALDRIPVWRDAQAAVAEVRIVALQGAPAINVIPSRAAARLELSLAAGATAEGAALELGRGLGSEVETRVLDRPCGALPKG